MQLVYIGNKRRFKTEFITHVISSSNITKILFVITNQNTELEVNLCELNLYLENIAISVNYQLLNNEKSQNSYKDNSFWAQINNLLGNLKNDFFLLLEVGTFKESNSLILNQIKSEKKQNSSLKGIFCLNSKTKSIKFYNLLSKSWEKKFSVKTEKNYLIEVNKSLRRAFKEQNIKRFKHTIRVIETANLIASKSTFEPSKKNKLLLACSYHDFSKNWSLRRLLQYSKKLYLEKSREELVKEAWSLHGPVASFYLKKHNLLLDEEILEAISVHSTPKKGLSTLSKVLIIADKIEPHKIYNFDNSTYQNLWNQLKVGQIENVFQFFLENHKPKTEWRAEIIPQKYTKK